jgi:hypothetical protein
MGKGKKRGNKGCFFFKLYRYDRDKESIFFDVFEELSNDSGNSGLVDYEKLRLRLISTGKFFAGDAVMMIEHMERTGKIEETASISIVERMPLIIEMAASYNGLRLSG